MKFLLLLVVLAVAVSWLMLRSRGDRKPPGAARRERDAAAPQAMLACAHCGVHLPRADAAFDAAGRAFCTPEHRIAGPR